MSTTPTYGLLLMQQNDTNNVDNLNQNLERLDAFSNLVIQSTEDSAPTSPAYGSVYVVGSSPVGEFSGHAGELAAWIENGSDADGWTFQAPFLGLSAYFIDTSETKVYNGSLWAAPSSSRTAYATWPQSRVETGQGTTSSRVLLFYTESAIQIASARYVYLGNLGAALPAPEIRYDSSALGTSASGTSLVAPGDWSGTGGTTTGSTLTTGPLSVPANSYVYFYLGTGSVPSSVDAEGLVITAQYA